jgi:hypothetical protein
MLRAIRDKGLDGTRDLCGRKKKKREKKKKKKEIVF